MAIKAFREKESAVVVRYRPSRRHPASRPRYAGVFLSADQHFKLKFELAIKNAFFHATLISSLRPGYPSAAPIFQFILSSPETDHVHDLELVLDRPGQIKILIVEAKKAPSRRAQHDDLWVSIEELGEFDPFADFSAEAELPLPSEPIDGLRFYEYVETAQSMLNDVVAGYNRLAFREGKKEQPDADFLTELEANKSLALTLLRQSKTFSSADQLREVIDEYTPIVRALYAFPSNLAAS